MSNYYYDEKPTYLAKLAEVRARGHGLTPFLAFGLRGVTVQCNRLFSDCALVFTTLNQTESMQLSSPRQA
jgi:hypothetical protein